MRFDIKEREGVFETARIFTTELKWIFREVFPIDVGIDSLVEIAENGNPKGSFIGIQIKTGLGNFYEKENTYTYYISNTHKNYWLNFDLPVIIIGHFPKSKLTVWEVLSSKNIVKAQKQWKIEIPKSKKLCSDSLTELKSLIQNSKQSNFIKSYIDKEVSSIEIKQILNSDNSLVGITSKQEKIALILEEYHKEYKKSIQKLKFHKSKKGRITEVLMKSLSNEFSSGLIRTSSELDLAAIDFSQEFSLAFKNYEKLLLIMHFEGINYEGIEKSYLQLDQINKKFKIIIDETFNLKEQYIKMDETFPASKRSRKRLIDSLDLVISEFRTSKSMLIKICQEIYGILY